MALRGKKPESFEDVINHFVTNALILEEAPHHLSRVLFGRNFRLPLVETVLRVSLVRMKYAGEDGIYNMIRQWQAIIEFSADPEWFNQINDFIALNGGSIDELHNTVERFILDKKPVYFGSKGDHVGGQWRYFYSDGKRALTLSPRKGPQILPEGWWVQQEPLAGWGEHLLSSNTSQVLDSFESAVRDFVITRLVPIKGPDYRSEAIVEKSLRLFLLERVLREKDERLVNDLIRRGWHIIALEYEGEASRTEELMHRRTQFVLGHPDYKASQATFIGLDMTK